MLLVLSAHCIVFITFKDVSLLIDSFVTHPCCNHANILGNLKYYFVILLTVHLSIILVINQLDALNLVL